jgi:hypothetical protein
MHSTPASSAFVFHHPLHSTTLQQSLLSATQAGLDASHDSGHRICSTVHSADVGCLVGARLGKRVGVTVGAVLGAKLGAIDGTVLGTDVGMNVLQVVGPLQPGVARARSDASLRICPSHLEQ